MDYDQVIQLSPEQLNAALGSIYGQDKGYFLGGYVVGYVSQFIKQELQPHVDRSMIHT